MTEAWQIAELLEEISRNADPVDVLNKELTRRILATASEWPRYELAHNRNDRTLAVTYYVSVEKAMFGADYKPEHVIEWLETGVNLNQRVYLTTLDDERVFAIEQVLRDPMAIEDIDRLERRLEDWVRCINCYHKRERTPSDAPASWIERWKKWDAARAGASNNGGN